jgi:beta-galactosidase
MRIEKWNKNWKFWPDKDAFALVWNIPENARDIELPHDAMLETPAHADSPNGGNTGFRDGGNYTYVKMLYAPKEYQEKTVMLHFEGIYMNAMVYVNEQLAAKCPYGYTGFYVKLNDYLRYGQENEIRVLVRNNGMTNSRWYSGSGIYRDVYLLVADTTYLVPDGIQIATESLDEQLAVLQVNTMIKNRKYGVVNVRLETEIYDPQGAIVAKDCVPIALFEQDERIVRQRIVVGQPKAWSAETPDLYRCISRIYQGEEVFDESEVRFGIRTIQADARRGLRINGETVKLRGACVHHDSGILGAATYEEAEYRRIKKLKEAGFNAIRSSHQPAAPAMLRACDALGMYVMDETFDMWTRCKSDNDYGLFFDECWEKDAEAMVKKDYNHPSVILYSIGNEIPEIGTAHGSALGQQISEKIKSLDTTRLTLASINGVFASGDRVGEIMGDLTRELAELGEIDTDGNVNDFMTMLDTHLDKIVVHRAISERLEMACTNIDVAGYNYMTARYEGDGKTYPNRVIVGSETYPPQIPENWRQVKKLSHVIGDFTWTGWDYIGEAGVGIVGYNFGEGGFGAQFPCQLAYVGDIDITGYRRPASYFRELVFGLRKDPYITVQEPSRYGQKPAMQTIWVISDSYASWTHPGYEGKPVVVEVYAAGDEVELFQNGVSLGKKPAGEAANYRTLFELTYEPGTLHAVSYENGVEIGKSDLTTAADAKLMLHKETLPQTEENNLIYVEVTNEDAFGVVSDAKELTIHAKTEGGAVILGFGSANPKTAYNYITDETETFHGRAQLILKRTDKDVPVTVTVTADGQEASIQI